MAVLSTKAFFRNSTLKGAAMWSREPALAALLLAVVTVSLLGCGKGVTANNNVSAITITPSSATVPLGESTDFSATVTLSNSTITTNTTVTWQVNGSSGGNLNTIGSIVASPTDANVGIYTAPNTAPSTNVNITAIINESTSSTTSATTTITSNTATVTVGGGTGLSIVPPLEVTVPAGSQHQFFADLNGQSASVPVTWSVSSSNGGNVGTIDSATGVYTAPGVPPPDGSVTITASYTPAGQTAESATATAVIVYSDTSFQGPFAFFYTGNNTSGLISVAGRFVTDGAGTITSGVEDVVSFGSSVATRVLFTSGSYKVGPDGRSTAVITTTQGKQETWQFVVTSTQHAIMTRFDSDVTGHGAIDQQSVDALANVIGAISGNYVFAAAGGDDGFNPMAIAGRFTASAGTIPQSASILDQNDNHTVATPDTTLNGSYSVASADAQTGRGTLTLSATNTIGTLTFVFYIVDGTHMYIIESDQVDYLAGEVYSAPSGSSFGLSSLASGNYAFTSGGNSSTGSYAAGGVFTSDGNGNLNSSGGVLDVDNAGTATADTTLNACPYTVDPATGRLAAFLATASGACSAGSGSPEFAVYQTAQNTALLIELDSTAVSTGTAYLQAGSPTGLAGNFALGFFGQGVFENAPASYQSDATGEAVLADTIVSSGNLDINTFGAAYSSDPIATSSTTTTTASSIVTPGANGRGTATIAATDPPATYSIVYYFVNANTAIFIGQDKSRVETGVILLQY